MTEENIGLCGSLEKSDDDDLEDWRDVEGPSGTGLGGPTHLPRGGYRDRMPIPRLGTSSEPSRPRPSTAKRRERIAETHRGPCRTLSGNKYW